jgi:hypothetical protein
MVSLCCDETRRNLNTEIKAAVTRRPPDPTLSVGRVVRILDEPAATVAYAVRTCF